MDNIFDMIAQIPAVTEFQAECIEHAEDISNDMPKAPVSTEHFDNRDENTLSFKAVDGLTVDVCTILDKPEELVINVTDEYGNQVAGVVISPVLLQLYLNGLKKA